MAVLASKPFPWQCSNCGKGEVRPSIAPYRLKVRHDGAMHAVEVPSLRAPKCSACGNIVFDREEDEQVNAAVRAALGLMPPDEIRRGREALGLEAGQLAERLGVQARTLEQWERGAILQPRAADRLLRVYFAVPEARAFLQGAA
ncbi:MAG: type II toxin-antitoxin system MqsA family antitoxin [Gemmataceae bacterium]|nr:type II toxin-antitoxin system MqsA family antitoxin [Gemmataceae bacterium]